MKLSLLISFYSATYMLWWTGSTLAQEIAYFLFSTKALPETKTIYCQLGPQEQTWVKFESNTKLFNQEIAFENVVCVMVTILSRGRWVDYAKSPTLSTIIFPKVISLHLKYRHWVERVKPWEEQWFYSSWQDHWLAKELEVMAATSQTPEYHPNQGTADSFLQQWFNY